MEHSRGVKINMIRRLPYRTALLLDAGTYIRKTLCQCSKLYSKRARNWC